MMHYFRKLITTALSAMLLVPVAHAGIATDRLQAFFKDVQSLKGDFSQTVYDSHMTIKDHAEGKLAIQRPGKFHWDYQKPYQQLIVANGSKVWIYDSELEQVTVKKFDEAVGSTPAQLLSSSATLEKNFDITDVGESQGLQWVQLTPRNQDTSFEKIRLGFDEHNLSMMELKDNFGQTTRLQFSHLERNPHLDPSLFEFTPPPGVDVVGE